MKGECFTNRKIERLIREKEKLLRKTTKILETAPDGTLKYQIRAGVTYYYLQKKNSETEKWEKIYLKKSQGKLIRQLAQKSYLKKVKRVLEEQLYVLNHFVASYSETDLEQIYAQLPKERKQLIAPIVLGVQEKLKAWEEEVYEPYNAYPEHKIYETERGEMVRSKSEVIIANLFYQHRKHIDYKYERPLVLKEKNGKEITIHPDFTIINRHTGKIYYYEHAGKMDDYKYATDFVKKVELYSANNILQGRDLLITYEAAGAPFGTNIVRKIVECIVEWE